MTLKPLADRVVVKLIEAQEKTQSGIFLTESTVENIIFLACHSYLLKMGQAGTVNRSIPYRLAQVY